MSSGSCRLPAVIACAPSPYAAPEDDRDQRDAQRSAGHQQARRPPDEPGGLGLRPDHVAGRVDQRQHRQPERITELEEAGRLVGRGAGDGTCHHHRVVGDHADGPSLHAGERGHHLRRKPLAQERDGILIGERLDDRCHLVGAACPLGNCLAERLLVGGRPIGDAPLEVAEQALCSCYGRRLVGDDHVDDSVRRLHVDRTDLIGVNVAEPAARDHRGAAHPDRDVLGGHDQIRAAGDHRVAGEAAAGDDGDPGNHTREARPEREGPHVERGDGGVVGVTGTPTAALGEEDGRQTHPLDQLEEAVLLAMAEGALGAGEDGVVVGEHGAGGAVAEEIAVHPSRPGDQAVGRASLAIRSSTLTAPALRGDRVAAVLDEAVGIDEVGDVLPRRPAAREA